MVYLIYLDNVAASFVEDEVLDVFYNTTKKYYANPNSIHKLGREENKMISDSTLRIANMLKVLKDEIITWFAVIMISLVSCFVITGWNPFSYILSFDINFYYEKTLILSLINLLIPFISCAFIENMDFE